MLELYHAHISTCSQKVRLCLAEKGLAWTSHPIEFATGEHLTPAYLALNPNGVVPTLVHDGRPVIDSSVICEYLEEIAPDDGTALMPRDAYGRARVRAWLRYIEEVPTAAIRVPVVQRAVSQGMASDERRAARAATSRRRRCARDTTVDSAPTAFRRTRWTNPPSACARLSSESTAQSRRARVAGRRRDLARRLVRSADDRAHVGHRPRRMSGATCPT